MKNKKLFKSLLTALILVAGVVFLDQSTAQASINSEAKKTTYSGVKNLSSLLKVAGIKYNQFNSVANGKLYGSRFGFRNGVGKPEGVVVHETADPGASAWDEARYFNNNWMKSYTYVQAVVDDKQIIQLMSTDYGAWGAGAIANRRYIQIELCEVNTKKQFIKSVANDAYYIATLLLQYDLTPSRADESGTGTIWSHHDVSNYLGNTDHVDPDTYFAKWGYSMDKFYSLITYYYNKLKPNYSANNDSSNSNKGSSSEKSASQASSTKKTVTQAPVAKNAVVMRNSYSYDKDGNRDKSIKVLKAKTAIKIYGSAVKIGKTKYYRYGDNKYVKASNITGVSKKLIHNSYVYDKKGSRFLSIPTQKSESKLTTYGSRIMINHKKYYLIGYSVGGEAEYIKVANFE